MFVTVAGQTAATEPDLNILFYFPNIVAPGQAKCVSHAAVRLTWCRLHSDRALLASEDQPPPVLHLAVPDTPPLARLLAQLPPAGDAEHAGLTGGFTEATIKRDGLDVISGENDQSPW